MAVDAPSDPSAKTILIVDDMPANLGVLTSHLERQGYIAVVAQGGEEGIERAEFVRPDLILLDVMMPGLDGFETCRRLKAGALTVSPISLSYFDPAAGQYRTIATKPMALQVSPGSGGA